MEVSSLAPMGLLATRVRNAWEGEGEGEGG